ncbi:MAG TPA: DUF3395 domain-containing protein [Terriglobales bacterium]|nr:DUF3395 domain-containing protein [Terriglobales bacterium]
MKFTKPFICFGLLCFFMLATLAGMAQTQFPPQPTQNIQANISGAPGKGKCTFEAVVDGSADVEIRGNEGRLRWVSGGAISWRRLDCNQPLPLNPTNFRFQGVDGRGSQTLIKSPNQNNGVAVIRLDDPQRGSEGYTGDLTWDGGNDNGGWSGGWNNLRIVRAEYGLGNRFMDVTDRLNSQVQNNQLTLQVNNYTMGGDPARGQDKILRIRYTYNGRQEETSIAEGSYLRLPNGNVPPGQNYPGTLQILRADYGFGNRFTDVTSRLNSQIRGGQLNFQVTDDSMGMPGGGRRNGILLIQYTYNGRVSQATVREGEYLRLPAPQY